MRDYAEQVLRPAALSTDRDGVLADRIDELRDLGLLNHLAPSEFGGLAIDRDTDRRVHEIIMRRLLQHLAGLGTARAAGRAHRRRTRDGCSGVGACRPDSAR